MEIDTITYTDSHILRFIGCKCPTPPLSGKDTSEQGYYLPPILNSNPTRIVFDNGLRVIPEPEGTR